MMTTVLRKAHLAAAAALLVGCASAPPVEEETSDDAATRCAAAGEGARASCEADARSRLPWVYIADSDRGIRNDGGGNGWFLAARGGSRAHTGLDLDFPEGTGLSSPCDGEYVTGSDPSGYGKFAIVACPVPRMLVGDRPVFVSMIYGHLKFYSVSGGRGSVARGQEVGAVGRSGNASGAGIRSHVHFGMTVHGSMGEALGHSHSWSDRDGTDTSEYFVERLQRACLAPLGLRSTHPVATGKIVDPFLVLACLAKAKPNYTPVTHDPLFSWSAHYAAERFDVNAWLPRTTRGDEADSIGALHP